MKENPPTPQRFRGRKMEYSTAVTMSSVKAANIIVRECPRTALDIISSMPYEHEIHVWQAFPATHRIDPDTDRLLSRDERERMMRFRFEDDRKNFLFCRSMLRILLASYLDTPPAELRFAYSAHGKPSLDLPSGNLQFNLSHSAGTVLFAFCSERRIGVDVERVRRDLNVQEIAERFFSAAENRGLLQSSDMHDAFFRCWTRKEAFVKARGEGLSCPLETFDVSVATEEEDVSLTTRPDPSEAEGWQLWSLNSFPGYAAAVAVESGKSGGRQF